MDKKLSLTAAAALGIGFGAGVASTNLTANAAHGIEPISVSVILESDDMDRALLEDMAKRRACPELDAKYGSGTCSVQDHLSMFYADWFRDGVEGGRTRVNVGFELPVAMMAED